MRKKLKILLLSLEKRQRKLSYWLDERKLAEDHGEEDESFCKFTKNKLFSFSEKLSIDFRPKIFHITTKITNDLIRFFFSTLSRQYVMSASKSSSGADHRVTKRKLELSSKLSKCIRTVVLLKSSILVRQQGRTRKCSHMMQCTMLSLPNKVYTMKSSGLLFPAFLKASTVVFLVKS